MRLIFSLITCIFFSTSYAQIYYNSAWNEKRLAKLLPVKDTIKVLYFGHNVTRKYVSQFETIPFPDTLTQFKYLEQLYIGHATTLISLENGGEKLTALKDVELSIQNIGAEIRNWNNLEKLVIYGMQSPIPPEFYTLQNLEYLYLNNSLCDSLPKSFYQLKKLHHLSLSMDSVKFLENGISNLQHLKYLRLDCSIKKLPNDFSDLDSLNELTLDIKKDADWKSIFTEISMCKKLKTLDLSYHSLNYLPNEISLLHNIDTLKVKLDVRNKDIKNINTAINKLQELKNLKVLELDNLPRRGPNYYLPKALQNLNQLKELYLHDELKKTPKWIESMSSLQTIRFNKYGIYINDIIALRKSLPQHINLYKGDELIESKTPEKVPYTSSLKKDFTLLDDVNIGDTLCINYQSGFVFVRYSHSFKLLLIRDTTGFVLTEELINCINLKKTGLRSYQLTKNQFKQLNSFLALPNKENPKRKKYKKREIRRPPEYIPKITLYYKNKKKVISNEKLDNFTKFRFNVRANNFSIE